MDVNYAKLENAIRAMTLAFVPVQAWAKAVSLSLQVLHFEPVGYYIRDGVLRRDHSYFRQRARNRRAALKAARSSSR